MAKFFTPTKLSENIKETPEGYLLCMNVPVARTGWQDYGPGETPLEVGDDGKVWVYRDAKDVFKPQTIASFNGKSVTIKHPVGFVEPTNWKQLTYGVVQNVRRGEEKDEDDEEMLLADLLITDQIAIGLINSGLREVSCGYEAEYEETAPGEGKQFNIIGNHIALVEQGRAGPTYAIKDHKGKADEIMKFKDLAEVIKNLGKTVDSAIAEEEKQAEKLAKKKKAGKTDDEATPEQVCYDDIMKHIKDMSGKLDAMMGKKDESEDEEEEKPAPKKKDDESMDEEEGAEKSENEAEGEILTRVKALEAALAKLLKGKSGDEDEEAEEESEDEDMSGDEDMEESEDEDYAADEEGEEGEESQKKTGDEARFEILTPGKKYKGKDARVKCLKEFAKTEDGAKVLNQLGMKKPVFDAKTDSNMIFLAASALVKTQRGVGLKPTKDGIKYGVEDVDNTASEGMTAEQLNEFNAKHYSAAK